MDDSLIHAISVIRRALGDDAAHASFIETIPRRGYRFMAAVELAGHDIYVRRVTDDAVRNPSFATRSS